MELIGQPKKYGKFKEQSICIFTYDEWKLTIHPNLLRQKPDYHIYQILFEGYGFCITLGDNCGVPKSYTLGLTYQARLFSPSPQYDNWRYFGNNKFLTDYQMKGFQKLRNILKLFKSPQAFIDIVRNDLKYKTCVPYPNDTVCHFGISIGSRSNLNPCEHPKDAYSVFTKKWLLYKYNLIEPLKDLNLFYKKLQTKIHELDRKWQSASYSGTNKNDLSVYDRIMKEKNEKIQNKIKETKEINLKICRKYFTALRNYICNHKIPKKIKNETNSISSKYNEITNITNSLDCLIIHLNNLN